MFLYTFFLGCYLNYFFLSLEANGTIELFCSLFLYSSLQRNQKKKCNKLKEK